MFELEKTDAIDKIIDKTKSNSGISGPQLAEAHIELGRLLAKEMPKLEPQETTIVALLRGGIFFAEGMYFEMGCKFQIYDPKKDIFERPNTKNVILVDSVINTGTTIKSILAPDMYVACCVINVNAVPLFDNQLYAVRVSNNSFVGMNIERQVGDRGPDTTLRLFNQI